MSKEKQQTAVEWFSEQMYHVVKYMSDEAKEDFKTIVEQTKEMENNSYICSKCKSQINGNEVVQQMQDSEKSD